MNDVLRDQHLRRISYLRLSVTDRCNLRCGYCMPAEGIPFFARETLLTRSEIMMIARVATGLGIRKIRVTGGEPLVRPDIVGLLAELGGFDRLERLVLTTNGVRLAPLAADLRAAGVSGVNISIDSLDPDRYRTITRGGDLNLCLAGVDAALEAGLHTKLNVVVMAGVNDDEAAAFVELVRTRPVAVRFIEYMPTRGRSHDPALTVPTAQLLERLRAVTSLAPIERTGGVTLAGPAHNFRVPGAVGTIGVISPVTCQFCHECNRIRVTASGLARSCLFHESSLDLKPWLRTGDAAGLAVALRRLVADKPARHCLGEDGGAAKVAMSRMGG